MSDKVEYSRLLLKRSNTAGVTPTIPPVSATTLNQFTPTDLFVGEMFVNVEDDRAFVRTNNSIIEFSFSGGTSGSTVIPSLTQVLNSGNTTGGFDILFPSGSKPVYTGLASGATTQFLGLDASGNTIIVTGATGGSGTSGTSGTNGSSGTSGVSGLGLFLPLSGGTVTGNTTFTQSVFLTNLTSGGSSTFLTVDSDTGQIYTATGSTGTSGTSGTSGVNGTSGTSGVNGTSGTSGVNGTSGTSGVNGTSGSSGVDGTSGSSGVNGTSGSSGIDGTSGSSGVDGTSGVGSSGTSGLSGVNGTSGTSFSGGSGNCITDLYVTNIHGCSPINVVDDIIFSGDVFITNITSGGSSTYLTIDSDTGQLYTAQGSAGSSGTSGTSGTGGGGGGATGSHFTWELTPGNFYNLGITSEYIEISYAVWANQITLFPFTPARNVSISAITMTDLQKNGNTGGERIMCAYDHNVTTGLPNNLIISGASIPFGQIVIQQTSVNYTFSAGTTYWLGFAINNSVAGPPTGRGIENFGLLVFGTNPTDVSAEPYRMAIDTSYTYPNLPTTWNKTTFYNGTANPPEIRIKPS